MIEVEVLANLFLGMVALLIRYPSGEHCHHDVPVGTFCFTSVLDLEPHGLFSVPSPLAQIVWTHFHGDFTLGKIWPPTQLLWASPDSHLEQVLDSRGLLHGGNLS